MLSFLCCDLKWEHNAQSIGPWESFHLYDRGSYTFKGDKGKLVHNHKILTLTP